MNWIKDLISPQTRSWEDFYRNRWQHDKVIRSTHGVNCTGGCSWNIYVKQGIVTWEMQALDYPLLQDGLPPYEPRGCQRGISYSWYLYSPIRVKYPYVRGALLDLWREARSIYPDPVEAWESIVTNKESRKRYQRARGKGGFRRGNWEEMLELIAASTIYTIKQHGSDRVVGFSPIPAMSFLSYGAGSRFLQLLGGVNLSFYDWYCDLPPASPEIWGEQTDVCESADWYNSKFLAVMGSNLNMTRTPDCHFAAESRHNGTKMVVLAPDFNQVSKYADQWIPLHAGQDGAFWMAVNHVILKEFHHEKQTPYFINYVKQYSDSPFLVKLEKQGESYKAGRLLRANELPRYAKEENGDWKFLVFDENSNEPRMPGGAVGHRWGKAEGQWNLELKDPQDASPINPQLSFINSDINSDAPTVEVAFTEFGTDRIFQRDVPARWIETEGGRVLIATVYDLMMAQFGVSRGLDGEYPADYDDEEQSYTPAWQEKWTGVSRQTVIKFAREWASTAEKTEGKCMVIIGAGINHWYHNNLIYRSAITALMLCGCVGKNGGGLNHYVGQEKLAPVASWSTIAFAKDWIPPSRLQNAPSWHYVNSEQWRYEREFAEYAAMPENGAHGNGGSSIASGHAVDVEAKAVRCGWLPFYPQFNKPNPEIVAEAVQAGAKTNEEIVRHVVDQLKERKLQFSVEDPSAEENWPRVWFIWRGNALMSSAKGHEFFLKHYLGTHHNDVAEECAAGSVKDVVMNGKAPEGKFDLVVDLNFRMDTSALYSDIVLPAATWYEKSDLNSTDMHSFIHPLSEAVPPCWESRSDWDIFRSLARKVSELSEKHLPTPIRDLVAGPLSHDCPDEIAQSEIKDWTLGECEAIPGKTMPHLNVVERDYVNLHNRFISLGPLAKNGMGAHGIKYATEDFYEEVVNSQSHAVTEWNGQKYPSMKRAEDAANMVLLFAPETNGELAYRAYKHVEKSVGLPLADLAAESRDVRMTYKDLQSQPRRLLNSPVWSGLMDDGRAYAPFTYNYEKLVPWRTLTGRQQFYLDHEGYIAYGENLPTYKPSPLPASYGDLKHSKSEGKVKALNYLTPHGKWHIHSTYSDNHRMMTLSRGCEPLWINDEDAVELGIKDNDWVETYNDNGVVCTRAVVSHRIPRGVCIQYHSPERTLSVPKSPMRGGRRAGGHNSLTRIRLKPLLMVGGYGQFTYHFNYWGPTGVNRDTFVLVRKLEKVSW
ncbi:MAG TPA: nitrate reductase subunit alpha [Pyrinomonadaceae bacterium]|nr:nitrate reductase subunit alpha [Pyrinomonadaceae bacterium]